MLLISAMVISVLIGQASGGRIQSLAKLELRHAWLPVGLFALQKLIVEIPLLNTGPPDRLAPFLLVASYGVLGMFLLVNRAIPGVKLVLIGSVLNLAVILANGGYMPVTREALERTGHADRIVVREEHAHVKGSKDIVLDRGETQLWPLSDIFRLPDPYPFATNFSMGDVAITSGVAVMVLRTMLKDSAVADRTARPSRRERRRVKSKGEIDARTGSSQSDRKSAYRSAVSRRLARAPEGGYPRSSVLGQGAVDDCRR